MSKPDHQQVVGTKEVAEDTPFPTGAAPGRGDESAVSIAAKSTRQAGTSSSQPADASERHLAFGMLHATVEEMAARGAITNAAGVAARIKQADPAFSVRGLGFPSFKAFLQTAAEEGFVEAARPPGASDVFVSIPSSGKSTRPPIFDGSRFLLPEIWRVLTSISHEPRQWDKGAARLIGTEASGRGEINGPLIAVDAIPTDKIVEWMRTFTATLREGDVSLALADALASPRPADSFKTAVRANQGVARKWGKFFRENVTRHAFEWADSNGIQRAEIIDWRRTSAARTQQTDTSKADATAHPASRAEEPTESRPSDGADYEALVRSSIATAVERMPLSDLLRLPIPAQYLIKG